MHLKDRYYYCMGEKNKTNEDEKNSFDSTHSLTILTLPYQEQARDEAPRPCSKFTQVIVLHLR